MSGVGRADTVPIVQGGFPVPGMEQLFLAAVFKLVESVPQQENGHDAKYGGWEEDKMFDARAAVVPLPEPLYGQDAPGRDAGEHIGRKDIAGQSEEEQGAERPKPQEGIFSRKGSFFR